MIRYIRLLGAALGGLVGLAIASANDGIFVGSDYAGALLAVWVVAWIVVGFGVLPYLTVVPATWLIARVEELSTAEFVTAVIGFLLGLLMGLLLGFPLSNFPEPWGQILPLAVSLSLGLGMVGLTVAKRKDLVVNLLRRSASSAWILPGQGRARTRRRATHRRRHQRDH